LSAFFENLLEFGDGLEIFRATCGAFYFNQTLKRETHAFHTRHFDLNRFWFEFFESVVPIHGQLQPDQRHSQPAMESVRRSQPLLLTSLPSGVLKLFGEAL
jgi:hypothetical protein